MTTISINKEEWRIG